MTATVVLVGADKGGTGKTTVARCLLDHLRAHNHPFRAFDTQYPSGDLTRFNTAPVIDISTIEGQMQVFDGVTDDAVTVVDICAGLLTPTIKALDDAQLLADVRTGAMRLVLLHVLGPTMASISEVASAARMIGGNAKHFLVKNHVNKTKFFEWENGAASAIFEKYADVTINVPQLPERACEEIQQKGGSFLDYANDAAHSKTLRGVSLTWLNTVWSEFDRVKVL
jgi:hypothetical protein